VGERIALANSNEVMIVSARGSMLAANAMIRWRAQRWCITDENLRLED
jgi:hypothetical protein